MTRLFTYELRIHQSSRIRIIDTGRLVSKMQDGDSHDDIIFRINRFTAGNDTGDEVVIESPFIPGTDFNVFNQRRVDSNTKPKEFSKEEIAKAAIMPYSQIGGASRDALKKQLIAMVRAKKMQRISCSTVGLKSRTTQ